MKRYLTRLMFCLLLAGTSFLSSCGPTHEERRAAEEAKRIQKQSEIGKKEAELLSRLESRHGKLRVFAGMIRAEVFTYELQQFFNENRDTNILFKGQLDDIENTDGGVIAEFSSVLGEDPSISSIVIIFRLKVKEEQIPDLLQSERVEKYLQSLRFFLEPTYTVVAKIDSISRLRRYEFESRGTKEEPSAEIDVDVPLRFLARGSLLEAVKPEKKDK
jgi:hypothetical protein